MKTSILRTIIKTTVIWILTCSISFSAYSAVDPIKLIEKLGLEKTIPSHSGIKEITYIKENREYKQKLEVYYQSPKSFKFVVHEPPSQEGNNFGVNKGKMIMYLPNQHIKSAGPVKEGQFNPIVDILGFNIEEDLFKENFSVELGKTESVLGKSCYVINIKSKLNDYFKRILYVDVDKLLILKDMRHFSGTPYYKSEFIKLDYNTPNDNIVKTEVPMTTLSLPQRKSTKHTPADASSKKIQISYSLPKFIPEGYHLKHITEYKGAAGRGVVLVYHNGLSRMDISFHQEKGGLLSGLAQKLLRSKFENVADDFRIYSSRNHLEKKINDLTISISEELPISELKKILDSVGMN